MAKKNRFVRPSHPNDGLSDVPSSESQAISIAPVEPVDDTGSDDSNVESVGYQVNELPASAVPELAVESNESSKEDEPIDEKVVFDEDESLDKDELISDPATNDSDSDLQSGEDAEDGDYSDLIDADNVESLESSEFEVPEDHHKEPQSDYSQNSNQDLKKNYRLFSKRKLDTSVQVNLETDSEVIHVSPTREPMEIQLEIDRLIKAQEALEFEHGKSSREFSEAERAMQEYAQFLTKVENSIAWRLKSKFAQNLSSAESDIDRVLQVASEIDVSDIGYLVKLRRLFLRRFWMSTLFAILAVLVLLALQWILEDSGYAIARYIVDYPLGDFIATVVALWAGSIFAFIVWYYKTWSGYERSLRLSEVKLLWIRDSLKQAQESKSKLTKLYAHTEQWIELIALSLHHPWQTDSKWEQSSGSVLSDEKLPNAVTVAQAVEGSAGAMAALERTAIARLLRPGWREQIFMRQIAAVARHQGIQQDKYNIDTFDKDSPSIPNGSRNFFVTNFRDPLVQLAVARSYLSELSIEVQTVGLLESKPPVKNDYVDDLSVIAEDLDMLGEVEVDQAWDGFLLDIVGDERDPIIPISPFSFTDRAVIENAHGLPNVHIQMPMRLRSLTESLESNRVLLSAYEDSARLPLDLVVRVDFVGPIEPEMLKLWSKTNTATTHARPAATQSDDNASINCRKCGRRECPAAAPGSNNACNSSGV